LSKALCFSVCSVILLCACHHPSPQTPEHSRALLLTGQSAATPGSKVSVGIQFEIDSGWHIYWQNPGDSGEAPRLAWHLPEGVTAGALEWPTPARMTTAAGTDYGYQGTTVLLTSLQIPASATPGVLPIHADLHWLVCHDVCLPQSAQLSASIRVANNEAVNAHAGGLLQSAAERIPRPWPGNYHLDAHSFPDHFQLEFEPAEPPAKAEFFPAEVEQIDNAAPQELVVGKEAKLALKKSEYLRTEPEHLKGVLVLNTKTAYRIDVPVGRTSSAGRRESK
jgi:thiol:disulfide interchange protein DsbD